MSTTGKVTLAAFKYAEAGAPYLARVVLMGCSHPYDGIRKEEVTMMSKQHFIALADVVKGIEAYYKPFLDDSHRGQTLQAVLGKYKSELADFCAQQNRNFMRERWLGYIAGECGPNGGAAGKGAGQ